MTFIDRNRFFVPIFFGSIFHPFVIVPLIASQIINLACGFGSNFSVKSKWVTFFKQSTIFGLYFKFIILTCLQTRNEYFPNPRSAKTSHNVTATVPTVEIANNADSTSIWSPNSKGNAT